MVSPAEAKGDESTVVITERKKLKPSDIVNTIRAEGYGSFNMYSFVQFYKSIDGKNPEKGLGADVAGKWYWYKEMMEVVRKYCDAAGGRFR